jgi:hypothetical protein
VKFIVIDEVSEVTDVIAGANGALNGVVAVAVADPPSPAALSTRTRGEYEVPLTSPEMVNGDAAELVRIQVAPASRLYSVAEIALPLVSTVYAIASEPLPGVTEVIVGAEGLVNGVAVTEALSAPGPPAFTA